MTTSQIMDEIMEAGENGRLYTFYPGKVWSNSHLRGNSDFSIPSMHRPEVPDDRAKENKDRFFNEWDLVCLNCNLPKCYKDYYRDDDSRGTRRRIHKEYRKLCPIEIGKRMKWAPERVLSELK